jgi:hypothetical protein
MRKGDIFNIPYPFKFKKDRQIYRGKELIFDVWLAGCHHDQDEGAYLGEGVFEKCHYFWCDAVGILSFEIIEVVKLEKPLKDRVIYRRIYHYPDGTVKRFSPQLMTVSLMESRIDKPFKVDYEVDPGKDAIDEIERIKSSNTTNKE